MDSNHADGGDGGGIWTLGGTVEIVNATISNSGLFNDDASVCCSSLGSSFAINLTIAGNKAGGKGGGVYTTDGGFTELGSTTIADNAATGGGGGVFNDDATSGSTELIQSLLARNGTNCAGTISSDGHNLDTGTSCGFSDITDQTNVGDANVGLGTLAANGGPTQGSSILSQPMMTQALKRTSPAVDTGGLICPDTDERGVARPQDGNLDGTAACDIGAFELHLCFNMVALSTQAIKGFDFSGTADVQFCGGGVWSNSGAESSNNSVPTRAPSCEAPYFTSVGDWLKQENLTRAGFVVDEQTAAPIPDPLAAISPPVQPATCSGQLRSGTVNISGVKCYASISVAPHTTLNLVGDPTHDDNVVYLLGGSSIRGTLIATNVLIYVKTGDFIMNAQSQATLQPNLTGGPWHGFMLWVASGTTVRLNGGENSRWTGTIYGPNANLLINGGSRTSVRSTVIGSTIAFAGTGTTTLVCDPTHNFPDADITQSRSGPTAGVRDR